jgi:hypothetical protein
MAVGLLIEEINEQEVNDYTPIASEESFNKFWMPICIKEKFNWISMFSTGSSFEKEDIPFILAELKLFKTSIENPFKLLDGYMPILERVDILIQKLQELDNKSVKIFIG